MERYRKQHRRRKLAKRGFLMQADCGGCYNCGGVCENFNALALKLHSLSHLKAVLAKEIRNVSRENKFPLRSITATFRA